MTVIQQWRAVRTPWNDFPPIVIHSPELPVKRHADYLAAKSGDAEAAFALVRDSFAIEALATLLHLIRERPPILVSVHAVERVGVNAIPEALADEIGRRLGFEIEGSLVQANIVGHTGASGFARLARQAAFEGNVKPGADYLLVDDFVGQGGTLTNLKGHIEAQGGRAIGATTLTGKPYSAILQPTTDQITALRTKHGRALEEWWRNRFGYTFDCLTQSEARYLERSPDADTIRNRIIEEE